MHSYSFENKTHFVLDDNSDSVISFTVAEEFLKLKDGFVLKEYKPPFWFSGLPLRKVSYLYKVNKNKVAKSTLV